MKDLELPNVTFQEEGKDVWIIWMGKDHTKLYKSEAEKLLAWLKKVLEPK